MYLTAILKSKYIPSQFFLFTCFCPLRSSVGGLLLQGPASQDPALQAGPSLSQDTEAERERGFSPLVLSAPRSLSWKPVLARVQDRSCCDPLPGDKTFPWTLFLKVMVFIVCAFIAYLPRMFDPTSTKKSGKVPKCTKYNRTTHGFSSKGTSSPFQWYLLSVKHGRNQEACIRYPNWEKEGSSHDWELTSSSEPLLQGPRNRSASSRSRPHGRRERAGKARAHPEFFSPL